MTSAMMQRVEATNTMTAPSTCPTVPMGNDTVDVTIKWCWGDHFDTYACIRSGIMTFLVTLTGILCLLKVIKLHLIRHPILHQYIIFYCALVECCLCALHWMLLQYVQLDFAAQYLKLLQFLVVCHFFWGTAGRIIRKETGTHRITLITLGLAFVYFTAVVVLALVDVKPSWIECLQPFWLALSVTEFALVQFFMLAGYYITKRLNEISTLDSVRRAQKRDLWTLIIAFQVSAFVGVMYDLTVRSMGDEQIGCSGIFNHVQQLYSPIFGTFMILKLVLPIWVMLVVFHPVESAPDQEDLLPVVSEDGTYTSVFTARSEDHYKPLYQSGSADFAAPDSEVTPSPHLGNTNPVFGPGPYQNAVEGRNGTGDVFVTSRSVESRTSDMPKSVAC